MKLLQDTTEMPPATCLQRFFRLIAKTLNTSRGLYRVLKLAACLTPRLRHYRIRLIDGSELVVDLRESMCFPLFMHGCIPHERSELEILRRLTRRGDVFVDIGANVGLYTRLAESWVGPEGHVLAFEPNPLCVDLMRLSFIGKANVTIVQAALSSNNGNSDLFIPNAADQASLLSYHSRSQRRVRVCVLTLDNFLREWQGPPPSIIKIDVEGLELSVLQGMQELLSSNRPPIIAFEYLPGLANETGVVLSAIVSYLQQRSANAYCVFRIDRDAQLRSENIEIATVQNDLIAIPAWATERCSVLHLDRTEAPKIVSNL